MSAQPVSEVILEELIVRFDGTVIDLWLSGRSSERFHVAHIEKAELIEGGRRGPTLHLQGIDRGGVSLTHLKVADHLLPEFKRIVAEIDAAARARIA